MDRATTRTLTLLALAHPRILATSITLPLEIIRAAAQADERKHPTHVRLELVSATGGPMEFADGLTVMTRPDDGVMVPDVLLIPASWRHPRWVLHHHSWQLDVIRRCVAAGSWVCSVGTGSFLLAEAGLLEDAAATTHWHWFDAFAQRYPRVSLRTDQLITQHERIFCAGSVNSIADLMVYLAGQWFSPATATAIENQFSPEIRRRFSTTTYGTDSNSHRDEKILDCQLYIQQHLAENLSLTDLSQHCGLSPRTLNRRFRLATQVTPGQYQQQLRIEEARSLLHQTNLPIAEVGWQVGYRDAATFSRRFHHLAGVTPRQYRVAVRGKLFDPAGTENPAPSPQHTQGRKKSTPISQ